jgi:acyl-CoA thioester hydrolase
VAHWTEERVRVRYGETDMMGHAYYANYLYWLEQARGAWCRDRGFTYRGLEEAGYRLPVVEVWVRYRGEVKYDDVIVVRVRLAEIKRSALKFEYEIVTADGTKTLTEAYTWHVFVGREMKAAPLTDAFRRMLERDPSQWERLE